MRHTVVFTLVDYQDYHQERAMHMYNPAHPGEVLKEAYLDPLGMSVTEFARRIGISRKCASEFINKHAGMSVEMAHRLAKATDTTADRGS